ncbi:neprilysin-1-like [Ornithodoros turicata]|uniref:neprilysin-1-like n=1 Tax=Ornithodoros turicata TaxID=34597 RepID=UPI0031398EA4
MRYLMGVSVDTTKDPCENFYHFVCNGAFSYRPLAQWYTTIGGGNLGILSYNVTIAIKDGFDNEVVPTSGQTGYQKSVHYYKSCTSSQGQSSIVGTIRDFLTQHGMGFNPSVVMNPLDIHMNFLLVYCIPLIFSMEQVRAVGDPRWHILITDHRDFTSSKAEVTNVGQRRNDINKVLSKIFPGQVYDVNNIVDVEKKIVDLSNNYVDGYYHKPSLSAMWDDDDPGLRLPWNQALSKNSREKLKNRASHISATEYYLFLKLFGKNKEVQENDLKRYFTWRSAHYLYGAALFDIPVNGFKVTCLDNTLNQLPNAASSKVLFGLVNESRIDQVEDMTGAIIKEVTESFRTSSWINKATQTKAQEKIKQLFKSIGYMPELDTEQKVDAFYQALPDLTGNFMDAYLEVNKFKTTKIWQFVESDADNFMTKGESPAPIYRVNAAYSAVRNDIVIPPAIMLRPAFAFGAPPEVNYGALGAILTHEIMHGYDLEGKDYDGQGINTSWFSSTAEYDKRTTCLNTSIEESPKARRYKDYPHEYLADNMGRTSLWNAYKKASVNPSVSLGNVKGLTPDKIFFVSWCLLWCGVAAPDPTHPPPVERCNVPLRNSDHFSATFSCRKDEPMNPSQKCHFW